MPSPSGPEGVVVAVAAHLEATLPGVLDALTLPEADTGDDVTAPEHPALVTSWDPGPLGVEQWPAVIVQARAMTGATLVDVEDGGLTHRATYTLEVLTWVRGHDYAATSRARDRYALAVRRALTGRITDATADDGAVPDGATPVVSPASLREDYSPVTTDDAGRTIAAVATRVDVTALEHTPGPAPLGVVARDGATITAGVAGPGRPLADAPRTVTIHPALAD